MKSTNVQNKKIPITKELQLLLCCSLKQPSDQSLSQMHTLLQSDIEWNAFYTLIERHRVYSVVCKNLKKTDTARIPKALMAELENKSRKSQMKALLLHTSELTQLMEQFQNQGIRALSLKGPALSLLVYGDISLRMSKDLDIIVSPFDLEKAELILLNRGYVRDGELESLTKKQRTLLIKTTHHFSYVNRKTGANVELHWRLNYESYNFTFDQMWSQKTEITLAGTKIPVLNAEENFLYLVFHGSKHNWSRLKWLCDIAELMKKDNLDWKSIVLKAKKLGIEPLLCQTLLLASRFFASDPHKELFSSKTKKTAFCLAEMACVYILSPDYDPSHPGSRFYFFNWKYYIAWNSGFLKKVCFLALRFYPNENDFAHIRLPDSVFWLYYPLHFVLAVKRKLL